MVQRPVSVVAVAVFAVVSAQDLRAALSANLVNNGTFETVTNIKTTNLGTGKRPWQFNNDYTAQEQTTIGRANDLGYWIGDYSGISTWGDPRAHFAQTQIPLGTGDVNTPNVSLGNGGHMLETVGFRSSVFQIVAAPAGQSTGTASVSFDYFWKKWSTDPAGPTRFRVWVYGLSTLPSMLDSSTLENDNSDVAGATAVFTSPFWDTEWTDWVDPVWHITTPPNPPAWQNYSTTFNLAQAFPYYLVRYHGVTYHEGHPYFYLEEGIPTDTFALGLDSLSLRLPTSAVLLADVNLDGAQNTLDIGPFVNKVTTGDLQAEADVNQDGAVNTLDIGPFVSCITGGVCGSGSAGSAVPEPATLSLVIGALLLMRRR